MRELAPEVQSPWGPKMTKLLHSGEENSQFSNQFKQVILHGGNWGGSGASGSSIGLHFGK